jgi:carboxylesterase type B
MKSQLLALVAASVVGPATAAPKPSLNDATRTTLAIPAGTVVGSVLDDVEYYRGIPFAQAPARLKPPKRLKPFGVIEATGVGPACPQMTVLSDAPLFAKALAEPAVAPALLLGSAQGNESEDCLAISVSRPRGTAPHAKLPVLFWIHGGGYDVGSAQPYNASVLVPRAKEQGKPFILVAVNYRLAGFGFLGGREILADGAANLGLLDQRMALEWVADNIASFGGDPDAVTIWGESAGAFSVFHQMALYDGDNTYKNRPLFRAGIMNSGSMLPLDSVDGDKPQMIFDQVAEAANCSTHPDKLKCLRNVDYKTFVDAMNTAPNFLGFSSLSLSFPPRPDGKILTASPHVLAQTGKYAAVPVIIGDVEDEVSQVNSEHSIYNSIQRKLITLTGNRILSLSSQCYD